MAKLFANSKDPDQTPRFVASDLGLHCLASTLLRVSRLQWVKVNVVLSILNGFLFQSDKFNVFFLILKTICSGYLL